MNRELATEILRLVDGFSEPINRLSEALEKVEPEEDRRKLRRVLGEVMGKLDGEISYPVRKKFGITKHE